MERLSVAFICSMFLYCSQGARILGLFPFPAKSHLAIFSPLLRELANRGHHLTVYSPYPQAVPHANLTDVKMIEIDYTKHKLPNMFEIRGPLSYVISHWEMGISITEAFFQEPAIKQLFKYKNDMFDLIIIEAFFNEALLGFSHKFNAPVIEMSSIAGATWVGDWFANPAPYSYVPNNYLPYGEKMNFQQRLQNALVGTFYRLGRKLYYLPHQEKIMKKFFSSIQDLPSIEDIENHISLLFLNQHLSWTSPRPFMPNVIPVGGMHFGLKERKTLPEDLQKYMDEVKEGVIYFSMGTHLHASAMPESMRNAFLEAFLNLKQRIIWKTDMDLLPRKLKNVKVYNFLPQHDLLHHPNLRIFITHCGVSSLQEATYIGVPIIAVPVFGDQIHNCIRSVTEGSGFILDFDNITTESVISAIQEVLQPKYQENANRLSRIFRDQPMTPLEQAVYWTEYVIRHKGAPHMRSAALDLTWYQYFLLDVIVVSILTVGLFLLIVIFLIKITYSVCRKTRKFDKIKKVN